MKIYKVLGISNIERNSLKVDFRYCSPFEGFKRLEDAKAYIPTCKLADQYHVIVEFENFNGSRGRIVWPEKCFD